MLHQTSHCLKAENQQTLQTKSCNHLAVTKLCSNLTENTIKALTFTKYKKSEDTDNIIFCRSHGIPDVTSTSELQQAMIGYESRNLEASKTYV